MKVFIVHASAGHGHKKVAESIQREFQDFPNAKVDTRVIDILDYTPAFFRKGYPATYFFLVNHAPWLWAFGFWLTNWKPFLKLITPLRQAYNRLQTRKFLKFIAAEEPDYIINTHFLLPSVLGPMIEKGKLNLKMITLVTDFKVHGFWINPGNEIYVGMCEATRRDLVGWGVPSDKVFLWGIPVHPRFRMHAGRLLLRKELELDENRFTILLTSGSFGMGGAEEILKILEVKKSKIQVIVVTGKNEKAFRALRAKEYPYPVKILGYANNMDQLMEVSDLAIVKPGGSTICELLVKGCPFLILQPIPGQEEGNGEVLVLEGISQFVKRPQDILEKWPSFEDPHFAKRLREAISNFARPDAGTHIVEYIHAQVRT